MEPKSSMPKGGLEFGAPIAANKLESDPFFATPEADPAQGEERELERHVEATPAAPLTQTPITLPVPVPPAPQDNISSQTVADDGLPMVANDDDLIEKEWVDKAKKIINDTKDDPYRRELEVGKLQADYLMKRYGRGLGSSKE